MRNIPLDIKAETLLAYLPREKRSVELKGSHKRNAYEDIEDISVDDNGKVKVSIARNGIYDILPESLFHPIDRFDNIPTNEYKERFKEECEQQHVEEENARKYFRPFDEILLQLSISISDLKNDALYSNILNDVLCDNMPKVLSGNRFVKKAKQFLPLCRIVRGNKSLMSLMIRNILFDENIRICDNAESVNVKDEYPRYNSRLDDDTSSDNEFFLGNEFEEDVKIYNIHYWNEDECGQEFLTFAKDMQVFEAFLNDYFMGIESRLRFNVSTTALPVRISDDVFYTYLDYNTNL